MPKPGEPFNPRSVFRFVRFPYGLLTMPDIVPGAKICYGILLDHAGHKGVSWPAVESVGSILGVKPRMARYWLAQLEGAKLLRREYRTGKSTRYVFLWHECFDTFAPPTPAINLLPTPAIKGRPPGNIMPPNQIQEPDLPSEGSFFVAGGLSPLPATTEYSPPNPPLLDDPDATPEERHFKRLLVENTRAVYTADICHHVTGILEASGSDLREYFSVIEPRLIRRKQKPNVDWFLHQAEDIALSKTQALLPEIKTTTYETPAVDLPKCEQCGFAKRKGLVRSGDHFIPCPTCFPDYAVPPSPVDKSDKHT